MIDFGGVATQMQFTEHCNLESILQGLSSSSSDAGRSPTPVYNREGNHALAADFWIAIVQNADSSPLFDALDAALQRGSSEKRIAALRPVAKAPVDLALIGARYSGAEFFGRRPRA
jgi:hypothetical protein